MARRDAGQRRVSHGPVEDVGHGAHHLAGGIAGQVGVGVERDHVLDLRQERRAAGDAGKSAAGAGDRRAADHGVEVRELAALPFATHPGRFAGVPLAATVEQQEEVLLIGRIPSVEGVDARRRLLDDRLVCGERFHVGVGKVGQNREVKVGIAIGEEADLQTIHQAIDRGGIGEHGGHGDERAVFRRDAFLEVEPRQGPWPDDERRGPGDEADGKVQGDQHQRHHHDRRPPRGFGRLEEGRHGGDRQHHGRAEQDAEGGPPHGCGTPLPRREPPGDAHEPVAEGVHEAIASGVEEPVPDVGLPRVGGRLGGRVAGQRDGLAGDILFGAACPPGDRFHAGAVAVASGEVGSGVDSRGIVAERLLHDAVNGDEVAPVVDGEEPQAADAVADRHLVGSLRLPVREHQLLDRDSLPGQAVLEPGAGQRERGRVSLQRPCELREECARQGWRVLRHVREGGDEVSRSPLRRLQQTIRPVGGDIAVMP